MGHSVEGRFPFLDYRVVELASRIPPQYRLKSFKDKFILRSIAEDLIPPELAQRPKQPYRAPISRCFLGEEGHEYVKALLSEKAIRESGYFHYGRVKKLLDKCEKQGGHLLSERENMAVVGILSTQLLDHMFIKNFPAFSMQEPENVKTFSG
jgi:asparagine synthase (glutamine-hydrolysing)